MKIYFKYFLISIILVSSCKCPEKTNSSTNVITDISGSWVLNYINDSQQSFKKLYPNKKPLLTIDAKNSSVQGNTSCNSFNGKIKIDGSGINFPQSMIMTKMACLNANGEQVFLDALKKVDNWEINNNKDLIFKTGADIMMKFNKK